MSGKSKRKNDSRQLTEEIEDRELGKYVSEYLILNNVCTSSKI
jgi:hypothetical protein